MDLVYIPEVLTFGSFRSPQYRDYEQPWNKDYFNYGKSALNCQRMPQQQHQQKQSSKENCHLCRESKRRSLAAYIRGKSRKNSCQEIYEEEEEHDTTNVQVKATNTDTGVTETDRETYNVDDKIEK